jgi:hypothetical protein
MNSIDLILFQPYFLAVGFGSNFPVGLALAKTQTKDVSARLLNNIPDITLETLANAPAPSFELCRLASDPANGDETISNLF